MFTPTGFHQSIKCFVANLGCTGGIRNTLQCLVTPHPPPFYSSTFLWKDIILKIKVKKRKEKTLNTVLTQMSYMVHRLCLRFLSLPAVWQCTSWGTAARMKQEEQVKISAWCLLLAGLSAGIAELYKSGATRPGEPTFLDYAHCSLCTILATVKTFCFF